MDKQSEEVKEDVDFNLNIKINEVRAQCRGDLIAEMTRVDALENNSRNDVVEARMLRQNALDKVNRELEKLERLKTANEEEFERVNKLLISN